MMDEMGKQVGFSFESGGLAPEEIARITADMWADLSFDRDALAALKRDGLSVDGLNLGGASPYRFVAGEDDQVIVRAEGPDVDALLDLWRIHFRRGVRSRNLAA
jgi:hypothetical protein